MSIPAPISAPIPTPRPFNQKKRIILLWLLAIGFGALIMLTQPRIPEGSYWHEIIESCGLALVLVAVLGRLWSILYIGSKKNSELVTLGPYSMTRNPLYFFSITGLAGIGLMFGSLVATLGLLVVASLVFRYTARREAAFLHAKFGNSYEDYARQTPLIFPRRELYASSAEVTFSVKALVTTFRDCLPFLALYPLIELVEYLHGTGALHALILLP
ncbi:isoprenylcysteine carboxylmethyltransferase family protein [Rhizobium sp. LCM 4573]|uniref:methyltransferase family protein n=1 Tax=Rhizobium sp. LCM 4573 TaxID=1848291 RepID=UPI0008DA5A56|nr:isoprenylcysteine carboxylmethyltransferase family protein [Rhizobium sp. LCM 4573]OHV76273.1 hypothetical protein LCM4573_11570 [Rhizobium sp. LCM 4573]